VQSVGLHPGLSFEKVEALKSARDLNGSNVKREEMGTFG
jgi:hypothetical protein